jgi:hypothetical protein
VEIKTRLIRLIEHILSDTAMKLPGATEVGSAIINQRDELKKASEAVTSLKCHFLQSFDDSFDTTLEIVRTGI